jgi:hypothetical protein
MEFRRAHRTHPEQTPEMFATTFGKLEFLFRRVRIHGHTLTLGIRESMRLETRERERLPMHPQRTGDGPH